MENKKLIQYRNLIMWLVLNIITFTVLFFLYKKQSYFILAMPSICFGSMYLSIKIYHNIFYSKKDFGTDENLFNTFFIIIPGGILFNYFLFNLLSTKIEVTIINVIYSFIIIDLGGYLVHRYAHYNKKIYNLIHDSHHINTEKSFTSIGYVPFLDLIYTALPIIIVIFLFDNGPLYTTIYYAFSQMHNLFQHAIRMEIPHWMSFVFVTPQMHFSHHNAFDGFNLNYSPQLFNWDRLFNTYREQSEEPFIPTKNPYKNTIEMERESFTRLYKMTLEKHIIKNHSVLQMREWHYKQVKDMTDLSYFLLTCGVIVFYSLTLYGYIFFKFNAFFIALYLLFFMFVLNDIKYHIKIDKMSIIQSVLVHIKDILYYHYIAIFLLLSPVFILIDLLDIKLKNKIE